MELSQEVQTLLLFIPMILLSLSIHEWAHAYSAYKLGDDTASQLGRMTINPIAHISLLGTIIVPIFLYIASGTTFGWAKPVPVSTRHFKNQTRDMAIVAFAGPLSNFAQALLCAVILSAMPPQLVAGTYSMAAAAKYMLIIALQLNLFLAFFNLIPLHPLDGSKILPLFMSPAWSEKYEGLASYSQFIIIALLFSGALRYLAIPVYWSIGLLQQIFNISF